MKYIKVLPLVALMGMNSAFAGYAEVGFEREDNNEAYSRANLFSPYVASEFKPYNLPFTFGAKFQDFERDEYLKDSNNESTGQRANKERQDYWMIYEYKATDDLKLVPIFRVRREQVPYQDTRSTEYRFYPKAIYQLTDNLSLRTDGYVALVDSLTKARGDDKAESLSNKRYHYDDYKQEMEYQVDYKFDSSQSARFVIYHAYDRFGNTSPSGKDTQSVNEVQARLLYTTKLTDDLLVNLFARFDVYRKYERSDGATKENKRDRFGVSGYYDFTHELSLAYEYYYQPEANENWSDVGGSNTSQNKNFYKLGIKYKF
ncbi:hypothetical protein K6U20_01215 [Vibrio fluvialis]|uniref:hypothetical protein n=1 Tax=Vibrio fluvialis TaxID=676 RepID=UPI001EEA7FCA|nr:hypothetical protein [Vibrio fluvialis]MCG6403252.1 hypothetical protein [Vibrio fluvialis]